MSLQIHTKAQAALNSSAEELLKKVVAAPLDESSRREWGEQFLQRPITDKDIIGAVHRKVLDHNRRGIAFEFFTTDWTFSIPPDAYSYFEDLIERLLSIPQLKSSLSEDYLEASILDWCQLRLTETSNRAAFLDFLSQKADREIKEFCFLVPVANLRTEQDFEFGTCRVVSLSSKLIDRSEQKLVEQLHDHVDAVKEHFQNIRKRHLGYAAIEIGVRGEAKYAEKIALERADAIIGLLGYFSLASLTPWVPYSASVYGNELRATPLFTRDSVSFREQSSGFRRRPETFDISSEVLLEMQKTSLGLISTLINEDGLTDLQERVRTAIITYSKGLALAELGDRIVHSLSALESLLLKGPNEMIQQNLGERVAFITASSAQDRMAIVANIKKIYDLRSKYVHHRRMPRVDRASLESFTRSCWYTLRAGLHMTRRFETKKQMLDDLDIKKFG